MSEAPAAEVAAQGEQDKQVKDRHWLSTYVGREASRLQGAYLDERRPDHASAQALLARLRRGTSTFESAAASGTSVVAGADLEVLAVTIGDLPDDEKGSDGTLNRVEAASYLALTLFAFHQQSQRTAMHQPRQSFGMAMGRLRMLAGKDHESGVIRAFNALMTASDLRAVAYYARRAVALLRQAAIAFDYGQFAEDLREIQNPYRADAVRLRWGRDFYRRQAAQGDAKPPVAAAP